MTPEQIETIRNYVPKIDETKDALAAFDALIERNRWRKQSEEPAPINEEVLELGSCSGGSLISCPGEFVCNDSHWMPLPEPPR
jgi:hypothetical protein